MVTRLREIESMCRDPNFDTARAAEILTQMNPDQEFVSCRWEEIPYPSTLMKEAAMSGNVKMAKMLLDAGANPNQIFDNGTENVLWDLQYADGETPEENENRLCIARLLLEYGANPRIKIEDDEDLLRWATFCWCEFDDGEQAIYRDRFIRLLEEFDHGIDHSPVVNRDGQE